MPRKFLRRPSSKIQQPVPDDIRSKISQKSILPVHGDTKEPDTRALENQSLESFSNLASINDSWSPIHIHINTNTHTQTSADIAKYAREAASTITVARRELSTELLSWLSSRKR